MATQTLIPAGDFRTSYAADTTVFPTRTSRNAMISGIVLICFAPHLLNEYSLSLLIQIGIFGIAALGLNIVVGFTGQISIGHAAFFGFGAFTSAYLSNRFGIPVFFCIPLAGIVTAAVGLAYVIAFATNRCITGFGRSASRTATRGKPADDSLRSACHEIDIRSSSRRRWLLEARDFAPSQFDVQYPTSPNGSNSRSRVGSYRAA